MQERTANSLVVVVVVWQLGGAARDARWDTDRSQNRCKEDCRACAGATVLHNLLC